MVLFHLSLIYEQEISPELKTILSEHTEICFGKINPEEIHHHFYAEIYARVCAFLNKELIGHLTIHKRKIEFDGEPMNIGGAVGACVKESFRRNGIAEKMMRFGLDFLQQERCDFACLTSDKEKGSAAIRLYKKLGYILMSRKISFSDRSGNIQYDTDSMFKPLNSPEKFQHVMNSKQTFHYGNGYW